MVKPSHFIRLVGIPSIRAAGCPGRIKKSFSADEADGEKSYEPNKCLENYTLGDL